jgi:hypothetical protein
MASLHQAPSAPLYGFSSHQLCDVIHMDVDVFGSLSLHWVSTKLESNLIVTPNDSQTIKLDSNIGEYVLNPKILNSDINFSYVLDLCRRYENN